MDETKQEEWQQKLATAINDLAEDWRWLDYLKAQAQLPNYSPRNVLLIALQNEEARHVMSFGAWAKMGNPVKRGEKGMVILAPNLQKFTERNEETGEEKERSMVRGFHWAYTFDVSQTVNPDCFREMEEKLFKLHGEGHEELFEALVDVAKSCGYSVQKEELGEARGVTRFTNHEIGLNVNNSGEQNINTMAHELGHILLEHNDGTCDRPQRELEAQSVSFVVLEHFRLQGYPVNNTKTSASYLLNWQANEPEKAKEQLLQSAARIQKTAKKVINQTEEFLEKKEQERGLTSLTLEVKEELENLKNLGMTPEELQAQQRGGFGRTR